MFITSEGVPAEERIVSWGSKGAGKVVGILRLWGRDERASWTTSVTGELTREHARNATEEAQAHDSMTVLECMC